MNSIKRLQSGVSNSLRSNIILFDLPRVVEELTYNSVDSGATKVYISISLEACYVKVEDDGCGITRDSLVILGERYATSKVHLPAEAETSSGRSKVHLPAEAETSSGGYGFRGESLASLSDVSLVEVRTKVHGMPNAFCKILKGSKCLSLGIDDQKEAVGTTVIVRDLFYNQPVRRTYMHSSSKRVLHSVKKCVMRIALVHPQVSFKVTDIASEDDLLCTVPSSCPLPLVSDAFGSEVASSLQEIVLSDHLLMLSGYLSRLANAFSTKAFQYLYINSRFITKGPIHNLLNNVAASFQCSLPQHTAESKFQNGKRHKPEGYPAFLLNLRCPLYSYDLHFEPSKTVVEFKDWNTILCFIERAIKQVWGKELEKPLQGDPVVHTDCASMETAIQEEGILKRFKLKNAHSRSPITNPLDISLEDTDVYRGRGISSAEMHSFSFLKPCQKKASYLTQAPCSPHNIHDSLDGFASPCAQMGSANSTGHWACDISSFVLDNFLDWTPKSDDRFLASDRKWNNNLPEDSRSLENDASHIVPKFDPFGFIDSDEKSPFSVPCFRYSNMEKECLHSLDYDQGCFAFNKKHNSFGVGLDDLGNNSSFVDSTDTVKEDSPFNRKGGLLWDTLSLEKGDGSKFWVTRSNIRSPEMDWYNSSSQKLSAKRLKTEYEYAQVSNSRGHLPYTKNSDKEEVLTEYDYAPGTNMQYESPSNQILGKVNPSPFPNFRTGWSPLLTNMQYESPSNKIDLGKVNPSPLSNFLTGWSPAESSNMKSYAIHSLCAHMQNQNKGSENLWYELECQNYQSSDVCKVRSRRSCSAPPFYRGKYRFPTLNDHVTRGVARKDTSVPKASPENIFSSKGLSQPCCVSQPCLEPCVNEITRPILRQGCVDKKRSPHEMHEVQNYGGSDRVCDSQLSHNTAAEGPISEQLEYTLATTSKWQTGVQQTTERDDSNMSKDDILNVSSGILHLSGSSLIPDSINKDSLKDARVLLQLDRKFIPVIASNILVIIDQHAADERIRLEELRDKVLSGEGTAVTYLDSEQELVLPEMGFQLLQKYADQIQKWGWIYNIHSQCSDSFVKNVNLLKRPRHGVTLLAVPCILGINLNGKDLLEFIEQLVETDGSSTIPPSVLRILNFKACRGAIMFGDSLLPSECSLILEELKATSLCFQCAHGRPTTVPLLNMTSLHELLGKLEMEKMGPEDTWHGLRRHAPTLERAQMRLESTKRFHRG